MKILVTGGAGFIGTALAKRLKHDAHQVDILDLPKKITAYHRDNFEVRGIDIRNWEEFEKITGQKYELIFHLAAQTSGAISQEDPQLDVDTNVKGTLNVCRFARKIGTKKIVFSSSMAVYGNNTFLIKEDAEIRPLSNYGISKASGEILIKAYSQYNINYTILRLFNVYGPGQDMHNMKQGMVSIYLAQAVKGDEIKITGSVERYRDLIYIDDAVDAIILAVDNMHNDIVNIGTGKKTTVRELIQLIAREKHGREDTLEIVDVGAHDGDQYGTVANIERLNGYNWVVKTDVKTGLCKFYNYAKEVLL
ncbi:MAG: NAD-dependent epimerase/dehydratase family protein [Candidatus Margulisbacteria bacterium]|nr:NAD-dependent epimerase/dehydratase family protein [Candidatus Margulisiibacteriota bacterium]